jgi:hypothetical protein
VLQDFAELGPLVIAMRALVDAEPGVWFVWTNAEADQVKIYDRMVASLKAQRCNPHDAL